jgi:hypothetical protein
MEVAERKSGLPKSGDADGRAYYGIVRYELLSRWDFGFRLTSNPEDRERIGGLGYLVDPSWGAAPPILGQG